MKNVNCDLCGRIMYQLVQMGNDAWGVASKEKPILVERNGTEHIKCPHPSCGALHAFIAYDNPKGVLTYEITGLKRP